MLHKLAPVGCMVRAGCMEFLLFITIGLMTQWVCMSDCYRGLISCAINVKFAQKSMANVG